MRFFPAGIVTGTLSSKTRPSSGAMYLLQSIVGVAAILATSAVALNIPPSHLEARDVVHDVEWILSVLKATAFCSSSASISDVTKTVSKTAVGSVQVTVTAACTSQPQRRAVSTTTTSATSTGTTASTTSSSKPSTSTTTNSKTPTSTTSNSKTLSSTSANSKTSGSVTSSSASAKHHSVPSEACLLGSQRTPVRSLMKLVLLLSHPKLRQ